MQLCVRESNQRIMVNGESVSLFDRIKLPRPRSFAGGAFGTLTINGQTAILNFVSAGVAQW